MAFRWRADDGPTFSASLVSLCFFRGSGPVLQGNPIFCDFSGGSDIYIWFSSPHPLWIRFEFMDPFL